MVSKKILDNCQLKLKKGLQKFGLELGIVSHIEDNRYHLIAVDDASSTFKAGSSFQLGDTYCREVFNKAHSIAIPQQGLTREIQDHPLYPVMPLQAYLSSPIMFNGKIWGTINFSSQHPREPFGPDDILFNERLAADISTSLFEEKDTTV